MTSNQLTNATVKAAIDALQKGDKKAWKALFTADAEMYDDGNPRSFPMVRWDTNVSPRSSVSRTMAVVSMASSTLTSGGISGPTSSSI